MAAWAGVYAALAGRGRGRTMARSLIAGVATAGIAYVVDFYVVPKWLTPGFEKRLSNRSLLGIYAALAAGLMIGGASKRD